MATKPRRAARFSGSGLRYDAATRVENQQPRDRNLARVLPGGLISNEVTGIWRVRCGLVWFVEIPLRDARAALPRGYVGEGF